MKVLLENIHLSPSLSPSPPLHTCVVWRVRRRGLSLEADRSIDITTSFVPSMHPRGALARERTWPADDCRMPIERPNLYSGTAAAASVHAHGRGRGRTGLALRLFNSSSVEIYSGSVQGLQILLSNSQAGPGRAVKQEQEEISHNHIRALYILPRCSVVPSPMMEVANNRRLDSLVDPTTTSDCRCACVRCNELVHLDT